MFRHQFWQFIRRLSSYRSIKAKRPKIPTKAKYTLSKHFEGLPSTSAAKITNLYNGAHIKFMRLKILYAHHAIVTDINEDTSTFDIIHFTSRLFDDKKRPKPEIKVIKETAEFSKVENVLIVDYAFDNRSTTKLKRLPIGASVAIAEYFRANPHKWKKYHLLKNNCEHFVFSCIIGYAISFQQMKPMIVLTVAMETMKSQKGYDENITDKISEIMKKKEIKIVEYKTGDNFVTLTSDNVHIPFE